MRRWWPSPWISAASLTDQAIDLFDRLVGAMFRKAEGRHARAFQADARAINEKVRLYARVGAALIAAQTTSRTRFGAIASVIPWERFCKTVAEAEALARPEEFDAFQNLGEHYAGIRRWSPAFLAAFAFESVPASASLMRAIEVLREVNRKDNPLCQNPPRPASFGSAGRLTSCRAASSTGVITNSACCRNCATVCVPATCGWPAAGNIAPSKND